MNTPKPKSLRKAALLNTVWPGTGQIYLGQFKSGVVLASLFAVLFFSATALFLMGMKVYYELTMDGRILEGDRLERIGGAFKQSWLMGLMAGGLAVYVISLVALYFSPPPGIEAPPVPPAKPPILPPALPK